MNGLIRETSPISFRDELPAETDVVVIGGGIAGIASAYFLAERGLAVVVCEKGRIAGEQSSRNWGWVRQQGRDWAELPIMMEANRIWRGLAEKIGDSDLEFTPSGCLYLADTEEKLAKFEGWKDLASQHQLQTRMLSRAEIAANYGNVGGDWVGGMITESDGRAEPFVAVPALARAAQREGAVVIENCAARTLDLAAGRVAGVVTEQGWVRCRAVVLAGGVWSTHFAANAGATLPQLAVRSTVARTEPAPDAYLSNISSPGLTLRRRNDGGYTVSSGDLAEHFVSPSSFRFMAKFLKLLRLSAKDVRLLPAAPKNFPGSWGMSRRWSGEDVSPFEKMRVVDPAPSKTVVNRIKQRLPERFLQIGNVALAEAWAGMIDVTPDAVPMLDQSHEVPGLFLATGLSGHGFGIGPAIGRIIADLVTDRAPGHDLSRFRSNRFVDGSDIVPGPY